LPAWQILGGRIVRANSWDRTQLKTQRKEKELPLIYADER
jgi:hypothetical protein